MTRAAIYIRTNSSEGLPDREEQNGITTEYARARGYEVVARYEDLDAPGDFLYHKTALKDAIDNVKELEEWEVLVASEPRCFSETPTAVHELVHKFALYGNRLECPGLEWDEFEARMKAYRREMSGR